jgi:hypothetical protein
MNGPRLELGFALQGGMRRALDIQDARHFSVHGGTGRYEFVPAAGGKPARLLRTADGKTLTFERFDPLTPSAAALADYAGRYGSDEVPRDMAVVVDNGALHLAPWGRALRWTLVPLQRDIFTIDNDTGAVRFERDAHGHVSGFTMSFLRTSGMRWTLRAGAPP